MKNLTKPFLYIYSVIIFFFMLVSLYFIFMITEKSREIKVINELTTCYQGGNDECGKELALIYEKKKDSRAYDIFLDLSIKGDADSMYRIGKHYIYDKNDCSKGIPILLNSLVEKKDKEVFLTLYDLFNNGICVEKDKDKALKYLNISKKY